MRKERALSKNSRSFKERFLDHSMLGWIKKQRKRRHSKTALWKKAATLQEKVEEMKGTTLLMWKQIRANGDMAVRQGYL